MSNLFEYRLDITKTGLSPEIIKNVLSSVGSNLDLLSESLKEVHRYFSYIPPLSTPETEFSTYVSKLKSSKNAANNYITLLKLLDSNLNSDIPELINKEIPILLAELEKNTLTPVEDTIAENSKKEHPLSSILGVFYIGGTDPYPFEEDYTLKYFPVISQYVKDSGFPNITVEIENIRDLDSLESKLLEMQKQTGLTNNQFEQLLTKYKQAEYQERFQLKVKQYIKNNYTPKFSNKSKTIIENATGAMGIRFLGRVMYNELDQKGDNSFFNRLNKLGSEATISTQQLADVLHSYVTDGTLTMDELDAALSLYASEPRIKNRKTKVTDFVFNTKDLMLSTVADLKTFIERDLTPTNYIKYVSNLRTLMTIGVRLFDVSQSINALGGNTYEEKIKFLFDTGSEHKNIQQQVEFIYYLHQFHTSDNKLDALSQLTQIIPTILGIQSESLIEKSFIPNYLFYINLLDACTEQDILNILKGKTTKLISLLETSTNKIDKYKQFWNKQPQSVLDYISENKDSSTSLYFMFNNLVSSGIISNDTVLTEFMQQDINDPNFTFDYSNPLNGASLNQQNLNKVVDHIFSSEFNKDTFMLRKELDTTRYTKEVIENKIEFGQAKFESDKIRMIASLLDAEYSIPDSKLLDILNPNTLTSYIEYNSSQAIDNLLSTILNDDTNLTDETKGILVKRILSAHDSLDLDLSTEIKKRIFPLIGKQIDIKEVLPTITSYDEFQDLSNMGLNDFAENKINPSLREVMSSNFTTYSPEILEQYMAEKFKGEYDNLGRKEFFLPEYPNITKESAISMYKEELFEDGSYLEELSENDPEYQEFKQNLNDVKITDSLTEYEINATVALNIVYERPINFKDVQNLLTSYKKIVTEYGIPFKPILAKYMSTLADYKPIDVYTILTEISPSIKPVIHKIGLIYGSTDGSVKVMEWNGNELEITIEQEGLNLEFSNISLKGNYVINTRIVNNLAKIKEISIKSATDLATYKGLI